MEDPTNPNGGSQLEEVQIVLCLECQQGDLKVGQPQRHLVLNSPVASVLVLNHPEQIVCPTCGAVYTFTIDPAKTMLSINLTKLKGAERRILTPDQMFREKKIIQ